MLIWQPGFTAIVNKQLSARYATLVNDAPNLIKVLPWGPDFEVDVFRKPDFTALEVVTFATGGWYSLRPNGYFGFPLIPTQAFRLVSTYVFRWFLLVLTIRLNWYIHLIPTDTSKCDMCSNVETMVTVIITELLRHQGIYWFQECFLGSEWSASEKDTSTDLCPSF